MTVPLYCLLGYVAWTLIVVVCGIGGTRVGLILKGKAGPTSFPADTPHGSERYRRLMRAHANCVENLPLFAAVVLVAAVAGVTSGTIDALACVVLAARVGQTLAAINVRFAFFLAQIISIVAIGVIAVQHAA